VAAVALPHNAEPGALCQGTVISSMQKFRQCDGGDDEIGFILFATIEKRFRSALDRINTDIGIN
jgi:hypothetical protein